MRHPQQSPGPDRSSRRQIDKRSKTHAPHLSPRNARHDVPSASTPKFRISGKRTQEAFIRVGGRTYFNLFFNYGRPFTVTLTDLARLIEQLGPHTLLLGRELSPKELDELDWYEHNARSEVFAQFMPDPPRRWQPSSARSPHGKPAHHPTRTSTHPLPPQETADAHREDRRQ